MALDCTAGTGVDPDCKEDEVLDCKADVLDLDYMEDVLDLVQGPDVGLGLEASGVGLDHRDLVHLGRRDLDRLEA